MPNLSKRELNKILKKGLNEADWELDLGIALQYEFAPKGIRYSVDYEKLGRELWRSANYELYNLICNKKKKEPTEFVNELINGDIRNLIVAICSVITSKYDVSLSIAIPICALIIKKGVFEYCSSIPKVPPKKSVKQILQSTKRKVNNK